MIENNKSVPLRPIYFNFLFTALFSLFNLYTIYDLPLDFRHMYADN